MRRFFGIIVLVVAASADGRAQFVNGGACIDLNGNTNGNNGGCVNVVNGNAGNFQPGVPEVAADTAMAAFALLSGGIAILRARRKG